MLSFFCNQISLTHIKQIGFAATVRTYLIVLADGRQEDDEHDVLETVNPFLPFASLTSNVNLCLNVFFFCIIRYTYICLIYE